MPITRSMIARHLPTSLRPYGRRVMRRIEQLAGMPSSRRRPGVVVMLHVGRCGSTVLASLLGQHSRIFWDGKIYRKAEDAYGYDIGKIDYSDWTRRQFQVSGARYYGFEFKILNDHYPAKIGVPLQGFLEQCKTLGVTHYILLVRRNTLRHVVSHYASKQRGRWHMSASNAAERKQFTLDPETITTGSGKGRPLLGYLQEVDDAHATVRAALKDQPVLEIEYESDIEAKGALFAYEKICAFLDLAPEAAEIRNRRINPFPVHETILNHDQIAATLKGTRFEWMLEP